MINVSLDKSITLVDLIKFASSQGCKVTSKDGQLIVKRRVDNTVLKNKDKDN